MGVLRDLRELEALADAKQVTLEGGQPRFSEETGRFELTPFSALDRAGKFAALVGTVDWNLYIDCGLAPVTVQRIVENAADGRAERFWLEEPLVNDEQRHEEREAMMQEAFGRICGSNGGHKRETDMKLAERLASYAGPEPVGEEISRGREC